MNKLRECRQSSQSLRLMILIQKYFYYLEKIIQYMNTYIQIDSKQSVDLKIMQEIINTRRNVTQRSRHHLLIFKDTDHLSVSKSAYVETDRRNHCVIIERVAWPQKKKILELLWMGYDNEKQIYVYPYHRICIFHSRCN